MVCYLSFERNYNLSVPGQISDHDNPWLPQDEEVLDEYSTENSIRRSHQLNSQDKSCLQKKLNRYTYPEQNKLTCYLKDPDLESTDKKLQYCIWDDVLCEAPCESRGKHHEETTHQGGPATKAVGHVTERWGGYKGATKKYSFDEWNLWRDYGWVVI